MSPGRSAPGRGRLGSFAVALAIEFLPGLALGSLDLRTGELGRAGENLAARALRAARWRVIGRRLHTPHGEVDLAVAGGGRLVCVEVKTGRVHRLPRGDAPVDPEWNPLGRPGRRLGWEQLRSQEQASHWLARRMPRGELHGGRVDLLEVLVELGSGRRRLVHHPHREAPLGAGDTPPGEGGWTLLPRGERGAERRYSPGVYGP